MITDWTLWSSSKTLIMIYDIKRYFDFISLYFSQFWRAREENFASFTHFTHFFLSNHNSEKIAKLHSSVSQKFLFVFQLWIFVSFIQYCIVQHVRRNVLLRLSWFFYNLEIWQLLTFSFFDLFQFWWFPRFDVEFMLFYFF